MSVVGENSGFYTNELVYVNNDWLRFGAITNRIAKVDCTSGGGRHRVAHRACMGTKKTNTTTNC